MTKYIEVQRRFYQLSEDDLKEVEVYASYPELGLRPNLSWEDLMAESRILILAEGGSGKTREMQRQVQILRDGGKSAFFLPLESLASVSAKSVLDRDGAFQLRAVKAVEPSSLKVVDYVGHSFFGSHTC